MNTASPITVLLVDDHTLVRRGIRRILEDDRGIAVIGEADDGITALRMVRELRPGVVLMDCAMPGSDGFAATREIAKLEGETKVIMLSMHSEEPWVHKALDAGASGYILKNAVAIDLVPVIKRIVAGEIIIDGQFSQPERRTKLQFGLTDREIQVVQLIVEGKSTKEIAHLLQVSINTVSAHRTRIARTLRVRSTAELVAHVIRTGIVMIP